MSNEEAEVSIFQKILVIVVGMVALYLYWLSFEGLWDGEWWGAFHVWVTGRNADSLIYDKYSAIASGLFGLMSVIMSTNGVGTFILSIGFMIIAIAVGYFIVPLAVFGGATLVVIAIGKIIISFFL